MLADVPFLHTTRFGDHDELSSLIHGGEAEFIQRTRGAFAGEFTLLDLDAGTVQFAEVKLPYLARGMPAGDRSVFILHLKPQRNYVWKGRILHPESIIALPPGSEHQDITPGNSYWALLRFDRARLEQVLASLHPADATLNSFQSQALLPQRGAVESLRRRLRAIHAAVREDPAILRSTEARRDMGETLLTSLGLALGSASRIRPTGYGAAARTAVARRVEAYLTSHSMESLYLADLCAVAGVGERTLRNIFQERFGMSPVQYLKLRRLHQVRRALRRADPEVSTVMEIAHRCGIWHLGRFASEYKTLFDESPLESLRKIRPHPGGDRDSRIGSEPGPHVSSLPGLG